ncbi:hypothetical protein AYI70_g8264 [Smittium culicis]|uniref:RlpA-like protein double-psi beta-barrel domain-containing protein n=1 Tax=Smittium culicis TaxID=133412 RepID=A0A1R1XGS3_9FUNG|nr:hypothetical protein AYI70_g8264 [Smittium culicis]
MVILIFISFVLIAVLVFLKRECLSTCSIFGEPGFHMTGNGYATEYTTGLSLDLCPSTTGNSDFYVLVPDPISCNKCLMIKGPSGHVFAKIVGLCLDCKNGDVILSPKAYSLTAPSGNLRPNPQDPFPVVWGPCVY